MGDCVADDDRRHEEAEEEETLVAVELAEGEEEDLAAAAAVDAGGRPRKPALRKEPSFSRWCNESSSGGGEQPEIAAAAEAAGDDSVEFELPLLHGAGAGRSHGYKYTPLDIETGAPVKSEGLTLSSTSISPWFVAKIVSLILIWYTLSTCLTLYNKEMLGKQLWKFPAPFLMNTVHFTMQAVASRTIVYFQYWHSEEGRNKMSWKDYFVRVVPTALGTALDINLSNISLVLITVTFATMCKSAAPIFILLFAFIFRLEKPTFQLLGIILVVSFGVLLTVAKETEFNLWGFIFIMLAAVMSGFRWSMTQILLQNEEYGLKNPFTLMSYVTPVMAIATALLSLTMDPWRDFRTSHFFDNSSHIIRSCLLMLLGGALAFFMVLTEYVLVSATSALTVTIAGIVKEAVTILVAVLFFNDSFTWLKGLGLATIIFGVSLFNMYKYKRFKKGQHSENGDTNFQFSNGGSKYVILDDDIEDQDDTG